MKCVDEDLLTAVGRYAAGAALLVVLGVAACVPAAVDVVLRVPPSHHPPVSVTDCETQTQSISLQTPYGRHGISVSSRPCGSPP